MADKINAEYFGKIFLEEDDIDKILEEYTKFWKKNICNCNKYIELSYILNSHRDFLIRGSWKEFVCNSFLDLMDLCKNGETEKISNRQNLINKIYSLLVDNKQKISGKFEYMRNIKIRFALLDLMLDVICSYSSRDHKILYPAIIYDMICSLNKESSDFCEFYGDLAAAEIVKHTRNMLYLFSYSEKEDFKKWIQDFLRSNDKKLLIDFSKRLLEEEPDFSIREETMKKKYNKKQGVMMAGLVLICMLSITFLGGTLYGRNTQIKVTNEKNIKIESLEKQVQDLKMNNDQLEAINLELKMKNIEFENEIQNLMENNDENEKRIKKLRKKIKFYEDDNEDNNDRNENNTNNNAEEKKDNEIAEEKGDINNNDTEEKNNEKTNNIDKKESITKINIPTPSTIN